MAFTVKVGHAKTHLSDLLTQVEAGEEVIIARGDQPIARLTRIPREADQLQAIADIKAARSGRPRTTAAEIREWIEAGRRY